VSGSIEIAFAHAEGALLRMLGLIERRGFELGDLQVAERGAESSLSVQVRPRSPGRNLDVLAAQLRRLEEVRLVSFSPSGSSATS
jgi:acetolactate synthase regulatory subunit